MLIVVYSFFAYFLGVCFGEGVVCGVLILLFSPVCMWVHLFHVWFFLTLYLVNLLSIYSVKVKVLSQFCTLVVLFSVFGVD